MTPSQLAAIKVTFKADIIAKQANGQPLAGVTDESVIADYYNAASTKVAWRTDVSRSEIYHQTSGESTTWDWNIYKAQSVAEQNAWVQMFMGDLANLSQANLRTGVEKIFGALNAQTVHVKAIGKRLCTRLEALFASPSGTLATPATMTIEGTVSPQDIADVLAG